MSLQIILKHILNTFQRAYCLILLTLDGLYAVRDKYGVRPLSVGKNNASYCIASESCCFENHTYMRDVQPGEIVSIKKIQDKIIVLLKKYEWVPRNQVPRKAGVGRTSGFKKLSQNCL